MPCPFFDSVLQPGPNRETEKKCTGVDSGAAKSANQRIKKG